MKRRFFLILLVSVCMLSGMEENSRRDVVIEYRRGIGQNPDFYTDQGWGREPFGAYMKLPSDVPAILFDKFPKEELSITGYDGNTAIGLCNCHLWQEFLEEMPNNIEAVLKKHPNNEMVTKYIAIVRTGFEIHTGKILSTLRDKNIPTNSVAHNIGLVVLKAYQGRSIGSKLQQESIAMLAAKGMQAIVVETTNKYSARVMELQKFTKCAEFSYQRDFGLDLDDNYTIWYRELKDSN